MTPLVLIAAPLLVAAFPGDDSQYLPRNLYLVSATCVKVWDGPEKQFGKKQYDIARLRVTKVYAGPEALVGREFDASGSGCYVPMGTGMGPKNFNKCIMVFRKGTEGIWWVREDEKGVLQAELNIGTIREMGINYFPYQKGLALYELTIPNPGQFGGGIHGSRWGDGLPDEDKYWKEGEDFAAAVAKVYAVKTDEERRVLLERDASMEGTPLATWALAALARGSKEQAGKFLWELARKKEIKLDATAQVKLDVLLCKLDGKNWAASKERKRLVQSWLTPDASDYVFLEGANRLAELGRAVDNKEDRELYETVILDLDARRDKLGEKRTRNLEIILRGVPK